MDRTKIAERDGAVATANVMYELGLLLLIGCVSALAAFIARVRRASPQGRGTLLSVGGLVTAGVLCCLAAAVLFVIALTAATDDVGSTWSNTGAHTLVAPMVICVVVGVGSFITAWVVRRRG